ncbi:hypothetical protein JVT61DRAFT_14730 [Boletus reticuloceps]|uniref:Ricin B lectin domain-containing protein n=1 Tax=Boletus reticuloceps TaxID=495285 RepID=A0A8I2YVZ4_9AGAM|nr:hypothetical protein JVT61DRAFT_14730 [Boletus reticuloceps]
MAPFIPDGTYVIRSVASKDVVCLKNGVPGGPIVGCRDSPGYRCQQWKFKNIGEGGNEVIIESVCAPESFVNAGQFEGSPLFGAPAQTIWTIVKVDRGYYLQSPDADFVWQFDAEGAPIVLVRHTAKDNTRWLFDNVQ